MNESTNVIREPLNPVELAAELTIAWLGNQNNRVAADDLPAFLRDMHATVTELAEGSGPEAETVQEPVADAEFTPAVSVRKSLASKDHIISMIDGKPTRRFAATSPPTALRRKSIALATISSPIIQWWHRATRRHAARWLTRPASVQKAAPLGREALPCPCSEASSEGLCGHLGSKWRRTEALGALSHKGCS